MGVRVRVRAQKMACGCVRRTLRNLCDVRAGAGISPHTKDLNYLDLENEKVKKTEICDNQPHNPKHSYRGILYLSPYVK